jgi:hypothetical protein
MIPTTKITVNRANIIPKIRFAVKKEKIESAADRNL